MNNVDVLRQRVRTARERLHRIPATGPGQLGAPDPETGERWHRGNVLGHVAEMVPFWAGQARAVMEGAGEVGRDAAGSARRREWIDRGGMTPEAELRAEVERGLDDLDALLVAMRAEDLERPVLYRTSAGTENRSTLGGFIDTLLVGHLESHLDQLESLT